MNFICNSGTPTSIFGGSISNSPTTSHNEPAKFSFATGLPFTPPEKSTVTTTTPTWKFGIDVSEDTDEPDSTNDKSNDEIGNATDSNPEASLESEKERDSNDVPVSESDKSSELTNNSGHNEAGLAADEEEENEPDSTEHDDESRSKDLED